jgi:hypothetical protein
MGIWDWFFECRGRFARAGDRERFCLTQLHHEGFACQETDPDRSLAIFTEGSRLAERLGEPWWVLFYDVWRVIARTTYQRDFRDVLDLAVRCALDAGKPAFHGHPWRFATFNNLVTVYAGIDPAGYAAEIEKALAYLDREVPPGPGDDRYVMLGKRRSFLMDVGRIDEARQVALDHLALLGEEHHPSSVDWYSVNLLCDLCWISHRAGDWDAVAGYSRQAEEVARRVDEAQGELAESLTWQALLARRDGDEARARRFCRSATARMARLRLPPRPEYFDALALYHEQGGDLAAALRVRDRELEAVRGRGRLADEFTALIKRCRLLAVLGKLAEADLAVAHAAAGKLRRPAPYREEIDRLGTG